VFYKVCDERLQEGCIRSRELHGHLSDISKTLEPAPILRTNLQEYKGQGLFLQSFNDPFSVTDHVHFRNRNKGNYSILANDLIAGMFCFGVNLSSSY
jgi:hypothetical protein